jgi:serine protease
MPPHYPPIVLTGRLVLVLSQDAVTRLAEWASGRTDANFATLDELANELGYSALAAVLNDPQYGPPTSRRAIDSVSLQELFALDEISREGPVPPTHSLTAFWIVDAGGEEPRTTQLRDALLGVQEAVETVDWERAPGPPPVNVLLNDYASQQLHLDPTPAGIDAKWVWDQLGLTGAGIDFIDIERGWNLDHEDLKPRGPIRLTPASWDDAEWDDHGTAVLGLVAGVDNDVGILGIAPGLNSVQVISHSSSTTTVASAITKAANTLAPGDVLLIESQTSDFLPIEALGPAERTAILAATNKEIIVIEPAGNGSGRSLDFWLKWWPDTRTIIVGASVGDRPSGSTVAHAPLPSTNVGARINCFAPGVGLLSAGGGDLVGSGNTAYTKSFGETSGASAIVAGAAVLAQNMHVAAGNTRLDLTAMRNLLSQNGTPQGSPALGLIGVMPDLRRIAASLVDVYVRDYPGDTGAVPSTGPLSLSPDIIVLPATVVVANPQTSYGQGSGTENSDTLSQAVAPNADHKVYVRIRNRGTCPAAGVTAKVFYSEIATLVTPATWHHLGTSAAVNVPPGDVLKVTPAIPWLAANIPGPGHYCFVASISHPFDPEPPTPATADWNGFLAYLRDFNNVTWRNFNVVDPSLFLLDKGAPFWMRGAPDQARYFDFEVLQGLPVGLRLSLEIPPALLPALRGPFQRTFEGARDERRIRLALPRERVVRFPDVFLPADARYRCRFALSVEGDVDRTLLTRALGSVTIRQLFDGIEVGRITWVFQPPHRGPG